jgi:cytidylate kinase
VTPLVVTIDGPAAAGKSSTAREVARRLGFLYLDTGALYRALAVRVVDAGIAAADEDAVERLVLGTEIDLLEQDGGWRIAVDGADATDRLRSPDISELSSRLAEFAAVRKRMLELQRELGRRHSLVAEGRDTGTVVFPASQVKIFLDAEPEERAARRWRELVEHGVPATLEEVRADIDRRDRRDRERGVAPLAPAEDSVRIDTTHLTLEEQVEAVLETVRSRLPGAGVN